MHEPPVAITADAVAQTIAERGQRHIERMAGVTEKVLPHLEGMVAERNSVPRRSGREAGQDCATHFRTARQLKSHMTFNVQRVNQ